MPESTMPRALSLAVQPEVDDPSDAGLRMGRKANRLAYHQLCRPLRIY
jgi:hypothetical protein